MQSRACSGRVKLLGVITVRDQWIEQLTRIFSFIIDHCTRMVGIMPNLRAAKSFLEMEGTLETQNSDL